MKLRAAVFLDRDGVINASVVRAGMPHPPASLEELEILPGVASALERLRDAGYLLIVVTNQPDVARGAQAREVVDAIHASLRASLPLDAVYCCFHDDQDACECRKPAPGMLLRAARELRVDLDASFMVGDRWRDTDAGARAGCRTVFVDRGYDERKPTRFDHTCDSLASAAAWILAQPARAHEGTS